MTLASRLRCKVETLTRAVDALVIPAAPVRAVADVNPGQDANENAVAAITGTTTQAGWSATANALQFTGTPTFVDVTAIVHQADLAPTATRQRAAPALVLERSNNSGGTWTPLATSATGYIRDATSHNESSNTIAYTDDTPGTDPWYRLRFREESTEGDSTPVQSGQFTAKAVQ